MAMAVPAGFGLDGGYKHRVATGYVLDVVYKPRVAIFSTHK